MRCELMERLSENAVGTHGVHESEPHMLTLTGKENEVNNRQ